MSSSNPAEQPNKKPWFKATWFVALATIFVAPVGVVLMWLFTRWPIWIKIVATGYAAIILLVFTQPGKQPAAPAVAPIAAGTVQTAPPAQTQAAQADKPATSPTGQPAAVAAQPTAAPTAAPTSRPVEAGRAWNAPIAFGQPATIKDGDKEYRVTITEVVRNASAQVKKANSFNSDAPAGMDYVLVKAKLEYLKGSADKAFTTPSSGHSIMGDARMWGSPTISVEPEPKFAGQDIFPGATVEGWLSPFIVPKDAMDSALLSYGKGLFGSTGGTWFSLAGATDKPGPLPKLSASSDAIDSAKAKQRDSMAPFKVPVLFKDKDSLVEIQVVEVVRDATREVKAANTFNKDPSPGSGYLLVKLDAKYISGPEDRPWTTPTSGQSVFAQSRMFGDAPGLTIPPEPKFGGVDLYPGGEAEGWLAVMELPKDALDSPILSYGKGLFGGGDTWFSLT
jgi:hypothetical protein